MNPFSFDVLVGTNNLNKGGILKKTDFRIPHENYTKVNNTIRDDIGLIKLKDSLHFSDDIGKISLTNEDPDRDNSLSYLYNFTFAGWGLTKVSYSYLNKTTLYITVEISTIY